VIIEEETTEEVKLYSPYLQLRMVSTSNWSDITLIEGGEILSYDVVSLSEGAIFNFSGENNFTFDQECDSESACKEIEVIFEIKIAEVNKDGELTFYVNKGGWGSIKIEIVNLSMEDPILVKEVDFDTGGRTFKIPISSLLEEESNITELAGIRKDEKGDFTIYLNLESVCIFTEVFGTFKIPEFFFTGNV
jgi:hypothetical protein